MVDVTSSVRRSTASRLRTLSALAMTSFAVVSACTFLVDRSEEQCETDAQCADIVLATCSGAGCEAQSKEVVCRAGACIRGFSGCVDASGNASASSADDAKTGAHTPSPTDILNACTESECVVVDNCKTYGLCGGALPAAIDPPPPGMTTPPADPIGDELCKDATKGRDKVIVITGSTNFFPFLEAVAPILAEDGYTIVFQSSSSCRGVDSIFNPDPAERVLVDAPGRQSYYFDQVTGDRKECHLPPEGVLADVGESDIYASSCTQRNGYEAVKDASIGEYIGPIQAMTFIVPASSTQEAISAEGAFLVYGRGGAGVDGNPLTTVPWTDPGFIYRRNDGTGTSQLLSRAIGVQPTKWWGIDKERASKMEKDVVATPVDAIEKTIGVISGDFPYANPNLKVLRFQAQGQKCGFLPDSSPSLKDRRNVRDGHYPIWGPLHFFTRLTNGQPSEAAASLVSRFSVAELDQALVESIAKSGNIPACAMRVTRTSEMGELVPYRPPYECHCFYEAVATGSTACDKYRCETAAQCPSDRPVCTYGYCEER